MNILEFNCIHRLGKRKNYYTSLCSIEKKSDLNEWRLLAEAFADQNAHCSLASLCTDTSCTVTVNTLSDFILFRKMALLFFKIAHPHGSKIQVDSFSPGIFNLSTSQRSLRWGNALKGVLFISDITRVGVTWCGNLCCYPIHFIVF